MTTSRMARAATEVPSASLLPWPLLQLLADGAWHSGEQLGASCGISRAAVWKQIARLDALGLVVERHRVRGYRLQQALDLLQAKAIESYLMPELRPDVRLEICQQVDSTNRLALEPGVASGTVYLAETQTAGRGRRGRQWVTPLAAQLALSVRWQCSSGVAALEGLSLAVGVVVCRALESLGVRGLMLKWPNDIFWAGRKLGGVLIEVGGDLAGDCHLVVGLGLNVALPQAAAAAIDQDWADLRQAGCDLGRNPLAAAVISALIPLLAGYEQTGLAPYVADWRARNLLKGQSVRVMGARELHGWVEDIDETGSLKVQTPQGPEWVQGGEVTIKPAQGAWV